MTFDEWMAVDRPSLLRHMTVYAEYTDLNAEAIARDAWQAAQKEAAKRCAEICREIADQQVANVNPKHATGAIWCAQQLEHEFGLDKP